MAKREQPPGPDDEPVRIPIEDSLDLHPFAPAEVRSVVESYLEAAQEEGFREVRLIHGRGQGVQRRIVQSLLAGHPLVPGVRRVSDDEITALWVAHDRVWFL